jgi:hypothetical protein
VPFVIRIEEDEDGSQRMVLPEGLKDSQRDLLLAGLTCGLTLFETTETDMLTRIRLETVPVGGRSLHVVAEWWATGRFRACWVDGVKSQTLKGATEALLAQAETAA